MPAKTERYRFVWWEIEDVDGVPRTLPGGYADVSRGGGMKHERVVFLGPRGKTRTEVRLSRGGTSAGWSSSASPPGFPIRRRLRPAPPRQPYRLAGVNQWRRGTRRTHTHQAPTH